MLLGVPVAKVLKKIPHPYGIDQRELYEILEACKFQWNAFVFGRLAASGTYLLTVPSVNTLGGGHFILVQYANSWKHAKVFDPNMGLPGQRFYVTRSKHKNPLAVPIGTWSDTVFVGGSGQLPKKIIKPHY